jgi:hypothetical protein
MAAHAVAVCAALTAVWIAVALLVRTLPDLSRCCRSGASRPDRAGAARANSSALARLGSRMGPRRRRRAPCRCRATSQCVGHGRRAAARSRSRSGREVTDLAAGQHADDVVEAAGDEHLAVGEQGGVWNSRASCSGPVALQVSGPPQPHSSPSDDPATTRWSPSWKSVCSRLLARSSPLPAVIAVAVVTFDGRLAWNGVCSSRRSRGP